MLPRYMDAFIPVSEQYVYVLYVCCVEQYRAVPKEEPPQSTFGVRYEIPAYTFFFRPSISYPSPNTTY